MKARKALHYSLACNWQVRDGCKMMAATGEEPRSVNCENRGEGIFSVSSQFSCDVMYS